MISVQFLGLASELQLFLYKKINKKNPERIGGGEMLAFRSHALISLAMHTEALKGGNISIYY